MQDRVAERDRVEKEFEDVKSWLWGASSIRQLDLGSGAAGLQTGLKKALVARGAQQRKRKNGSEDPPLQRELISYNDAAFKMFAKRTDWNMTPNRLSETLAAHRAAGKPLIDLRSEERRVGTVE